MSYDPNDPNQARLIEAQRLAEQDQRYLVVRVMINQQPQVDYLVKTTQGDLWVQDRRAAVRFTLALAIQATCRHPIHEHVTVGIVRDKPFAPARYLIDEATGLTFPDPTQAAIDEAKAWATVTGQTFPDPSKADK